MTAELEEKAKRMARDYFNEHKHLADYMECLEFSWETGGERFQWYWMEQAKQEE